MTLTLIGRPEVQGVQARSTSVAFRMQGKEPDRLPKGLPPVPSQGPITWLVAIALRQWTRVQDSLAAHADDKLIITGHPVVASDSAHMLLTQSCVSMWQQGEKRQTPPTLGLRQLGVKRTGFLELFPKGYLLFFKGLMISRPRNIQSS